MGEARACAWWRPQDHGGGPAFAAGTPRTPGYAAVVRPGEAIFVPAGWWHAVLNLDTAVAVTQNFAEPRNFERVWQAVAEGRGDLVAVFYDKLKVAYPDLAARADEMGGVAAVRANLAIGDLFASFLECDPGNLDSDSEEDGEI